jgi:hypothetical protein
MSVCKKVTSSQLERNVSCFKLGFVSRQIIKFILNTNFIK